MKAEGVPGVADARDLLMACLMVAVPLGAVSGAAVERGPPRAPADCPVVVETVPGGVGCVDAEAATRAAVTAGDRLRWADGRVARERMAPAALAAWTLPVDVNRASAGELASLDGIGPKLAERIVAHRPFRALDELAHVPGVGARRLALLRPRLRL